MVALNGSIIAYSGPETVSPHIIHELVYKPWPPTIYADVAMILGSGPLVKGSPTMPAKALSGPILGTYYDDYYDRVHIDPLLFELGNITSPQQRTVSVWNAYPFQTVNNPDIQLTNAQGISLTGDTPPLVYTPLQERFYTFNITMDGPPEIDARAQWIFTGVPSWPVVITGMRAIILPFPPEVPVKETWGWLTDIDTSADGHEQRRGLRGGGPRVAIQERFLLTDLQDTRDLQGILNVAKGRVFLPYWQYGTKATQESPVNGTTIYVDTTLMDLRGLDYVFADLENNPTLLRVLAFTGTSITVEPLVYAIPPYTNIVPCYQSILENNINLGRTRYGGVSDTEIKAEKKQPRADFIDGSNTTVLTTYKGLPVLEKQPVQSGNLFDNIFDNGKEIIDYGVGLMTDIMLWDQVQNTLNFTFLMPRLVARTEIDYWRKFFDYCKGKLNPFYMSSWRSDQDFSTHPTVGTNELRFAGTKYFESFFENSSYKHLELTFADGVKRRYEVTGVATVAGNTVATITPNLPASAGAGWTTIVNVAYLYKMRLDTDNITVEHGHTDSKFSFTARTIIE